MGKPTKLTLSARARTGAFVAVSIDPVASMGDLQSDEVTALCKEMKTKKYIAYVDMVRPHTAQISALLTLRHTQRRPETFTPSSSYHTYNFFFAYQGLSYLIDAQGSQMDIPIFPNTIHESRPPVNPSKPFPWDDCYISIFPSVKARVAQRLVEHEAATMLSAEERSRLDMFMFEDKTRRPELLTTPTVTNFEWCPDQLGFGGRRCTPDWEDESISVKLRSGRDIAPSRDHTVPVITWSYDLSSAEIVNDPLEFYEELAVLDR